MALINTLRKRMGKIVVGVVAFSMFAFILTDFLQSNSSLLGGSDRTIAEIGGTKISYERFQEEVDRLSNVFALNNGRGPRSEEQDAIRDQAWNSLILKYAYEPQIERLGIQVTDAELKDMVQGNNIDDQIKQFFSDPNSGQFDKQRVIEFLRNMSNADRQQQASWISFENTLRPNRKVRKYENLIEKTAYVTEAEAKNKHAQQETSMSVDYFYVPFFSVPDSAFQVSQSEMEDYLSNNEDQYQREESRSISYVVLPIQPSSDDTLFVQEEMSKVIEGLKASDNDSLFALRNSERQDAYRIIADPSELPEGLEGASVGTITEPVVEDGSYVVYKLSEVSKGEEAFVKARHILIKAEGSSDEAKAEAEKKAKDLIRQLKRGADFNELAAANSQDQSNARNGGDLGWFGENGGFVQPFKDAAFAHKGTGVIPTPVETSFGYHVIRIDEPKTYQVYKVAVIEKELFESDATLNEAYRQADLLAANSKGAEGLTSNAKEAGLEVKTARSIAKNDSRVGVLQDARRIVLWLYNDAEVGDVSEVFELDKNYVVAVVTGEQNEGLADLSQVKNEVRTKVLNKKKADLIKKKMSELAGDDFDAMKEAYGKDARTGNADLSLGSNSFPNVGFAPEAVGVSFSLEEGEQTKPFETPNGLLIIKATAKAELADLDDYSLYMTQIANERKTRKTVIANFPLSFAPLFVSQKIDNAVKEFSDIDDQRYKFF